jgi:hypothetical protein
MEHRLGVDKKIVQLPSSAEQVFESSANISNTPMRWDEFLKELKMQWRIMWHERIDDKVRAEGISKKDYSLLFLESGTVIVATRKYKAPDFFEIMERNRAIFGVGRDIEGANPSVGGWKKFIKTVLNKQQRFARRKKPEFPNSKGRNNLQQKKGGRGWVHQF